MIYQQTIKLTKTKELIFTTGFVGLAVYVPYLVHYFGGIEIGRSFLPMPFFVLLAGLLLGWRAGLVAGLVSPLISNFISGMPVVNVLPFIVVELAGYGLIAGALRQKYNIFISLIGAMIAGRLLAGMVIFLFSDINAGNYILSAVKDGWQGIALQVLLLPVTVEIISSSLFQREVRRDY